MALLFLFLILPLTIGGIVFLFGFTGCGLDAVGEARAFPPQNLTATAAGTDRITLSWTPDPMSGGPDFIIERADPGKPFQPLPGVLIQATNFTDQGLAAGTTFLYRVRASFQGSDESDPSNVATATTLSVTPPPPPPPPPGFVPVTHTYDNGTGSETILTSASQLVVEVWGAGGSGRFGSTLGSGGGGGAYSSKTLSAPFAAGAISWTAGSGGAAQTASNSNGNAGGNSVAGGSGQLVNISNVGGGAGGTTTGGVGGNAGTGGDTNTPGGPAAGATGGNAAGSGGGAGGAKDGVVPGGGGGAAVQSLGTPRSGAGANGRVRFSWT